MKTRIAAIATAAVLVVGGGTAYALSSNDQPAPVETVTSTPEATPTETAEPEATEPIVAESPAPPVAADDPEAAYLIEVRARLARIQTQIPNVTEEQLLTLGWDACGRVERGEPTEGMSLIEGEAKSDAGYYSDSSAIIIAARLTLCHPVTE